MHEDHDIATRRVFYIPGFDPFPPRRYRELYRKEGAEQARISGYELSLTGAGPFGWDVSTRMDGAQVETRMQVLVWNDIVRASMSNGIAQTYWQLCRTAWIYLRSGALWRMTRLRQGPVIAALYPVVMLLAQGGVALLAAWLVYRLGAIGLPSWLAVLCGLAQIPLVLRWWRARDGKLYAYYLMHDYAFTAREGGAYPPALEARLSEMRDTIAKALDSDVDEVLVVGHSSGVHLAVSVLAELVRTRDPARTGPRLGFLSLGHVVPMIAFLPKSSALRRDLNVMSGSAEISWVDVTAPGDACSFALCDPVSVSGVAPEVKRWPLVISAQFTAALGPARWRALKWRYFRRHFQYLCAFDRPKAYDYFAITAGPVSLARRFSGHPPSESRLETPVSPHRTMAP